MDTISTLICHDLFKGEVRVKIMRFSEILDQVKCSFSFLFDSYGFREISHVYSEESFGDFAVALQSGDLRLRIVRDKGQVFLDVGTLIDPNIWFDLRTVVEFIRLYRSEEAPPVGNHELEATAGRIAGQLDSLSQILKLYYPAIRELFATENYGRNKVGLKTYRRDEVKRLFAPKNVDMEPSNENRKE